MAWWYLKIDIKKISICILFLNQINYVRFYITSKFHLSIILYLKLYFIFLLCVLIFTFFWWLFFVARVIILRKILIICTPQRYFLNQFVNKIVIISDSVHVSPQPLLTYGACYALSKRAAEFDIRAASSDELVFGMSKSGKCIDGRCWQHFTHWNGVVRRHHVGIDEMLVCDSH